MKKLTAFIICLVLCLSFVACGESKTENPGGDGQQTEQKDNTNKTNPDDEPGTYTAEDMISEIKQQFGVDVADIVNAKDVSGMTKKEQTEFMTYLYNYAHYNGMTSEDIIKNDMPGVSEKTEELIKKELEDKNFDNGTADDKIEIGKDVTEKYSFYDYTETQAIEAVQKRYDTTEEYAKAMLVDNGYYETEDAAERSKILYLLLVVY